MGSNLMDQGGGLKLSTPFGSAPLSGTARAWAQIEIREEHMQLGTKPKSTRLKALEGNPGSRPLPPNEPVVEEPLGSAPDNWPAVAKELWAKIAGEVPFGVASKADRVAFEIFVQIRGRSRGAR
jgi:hypothetical protein